MVPSDVLLQNAAEDQTAKEQLVRENTGLIYMVINRFRHRGVEIDDLFQIAALGLLKALDAFDPAFGVRFSTYAVPVMLGEVKRYLRDNTPIRVSRSYKSLAGKAADLRERLAAETGREPTVGELAEKLEVRPEELSVALSAAQPPVSLEEPQKETDMPLKEQIAAPTKEFDFADRLALNQLIDSLPERERTLIFLRYIREQTQEQISKRLGISQVQVSRLEKKILLKLRSELTDGG